MFFSLFTLFVLIQLVPANLATVDVSDANAKFLACCNEIDLNQNTREHGQLVVWKVPTNECLC